MTRAEWLSGIESDLTLLLHALDNGQEICSACGLTHWTNRSEHQAVEALQGMIEKLQRLQGQDWAQQELHV